MHPAARLSGIGYDQAEASPLAEASPHRGHRMDPIFLSGLALFVAPSTGYAFGCDPNRRTTEVMTYGGAFRPHRAEAESPEAGLMETSPAAELTELLRRCADADRAAF